MSKRFMKVLMVLCVILTAFNIACCVHIWSGNDSLNRQRSAYAYTEETDGSIIVSVAKDKRLRCYFGKDSVKIKSSYRVNDKDEIVRIILFVRSYAEEKGYRITRENTELYGEYRLHNILYEWGVEREKTVDLDLDYNQDARWYVNTASAVIGWYRI